MCANTVSFQKDVCDGHRCSSCQPFSNRIFPRGDKWIVFLKVDREILFQKSEWVVRSTRYVGSISKRVHLLFLYPSTKSLHIQRFVVFCIKHDGFLMTTSLVT